MLDYKELSEVIYNFDNGNKKDFLIGMKEIKQNGQEEEFLNTHLSVYKKEYQIEILSYFYKHY